MHAGSARFRAVLPGLSVSARPVATTIEASHINGRAKIKIEVSA
jgi:hypothetical protein